MTSLVYQSTRHIQARMWRIYWSGNVTWKIYLSPSDREWWTCVFRGDIDAMERLPYHPMVGEVRYDNNALTILPTGEYYLLEELQKAAGDILGAYSRFSDVTVLPLRGGSWDFGKMKVGEDVSLWETVLLNSDRSVTPGRVVLRRLDWDPEKMPLQVEELEANGVQVPCWLPVKLPQTRVLHQLLGRVGQLRYSENPELLSTVVSAPSALWVRGTNSKYNCHCFQLPDLQEVIWSVHRRTQIKNTLRPPFHYGPNVRRLVIHYIAEEDIRLVLPSGWTEIVFHYRSTRGRLHLLFKTPGLVLQWYGPESDRVTLDWVRGCEPIFYLRKKSARSILVN